MSTDVVAAITRKERNNGTHEYQYCHFGPRAIGGYGKGAVITVLCRFDDSCKNGHDTFSITAEVRLPGKRDIEAGGCLHGDIVKVFPELEPLIKWHLCSTDGPMHGIANTIYHAGNRDHHGLLKGEVRQIRNGRTGKPCWIASKFEGQRYVDSDECPADTQIIKYEPLNRVGEGKNRDLDAARRSAVWPEATDEQLCSPPEVLKALLEERLPALLVEFRKAMEGLGFTWL